MLARSAAIDARPMDALLDLLRAMHLTGGVFLDAEFTAPWCVASRVAPEDCRAFLPDPAHVVAYHYVMEGRLLMEVSGQPTSPSGPGRSSCCRATIRIGWGARWTSPRSAPTT
jgi:Cupin